MCTYLDHEDFHEQLWVSCVGDSRIRTGNDYRHTTHQVTQTDRQTAPEEREACKVVLWRP